LLDGGAPLYARSRVRIRDLSPTRRAQLAVLYRFPRGLVYARFSNLPDVSLATVIAKPSSTGALYVRLSYGAHRARPRVQRTLWHENPKAPVAPPVTPGLVATPQPYTPPVNPATCGVSSVGATCDSYFDGLWHLEGPGWTGGDGALSVPLPDGREAWLFGDTFLGTISSNGTRPLDSPMVHNSIVVQRDQHLETISGPGDTAVVPDEGTDRWYWPGDGVVEGSHLRVIMQEFERTGPGSFDFAFVDSAVASFSLPDFDYEGLTPLAHADDSIWGNWMLDDGAWTYIYGYRDDPDTPPLVARAPRGQIQAAWQYFDGSGWSTVPEDAAPFASGVPNQYAVVPADDGYSLISMGPGLSPNVYRRFASSPTGPFGTPRLLYTAPANPDVLVYGAVAHPEHAENAGLLVSYSVNAAQPEALYTHPEYYRPRFIRVPYAALGR
jgi:hypothetical protein